MRIARFLIIALVIVLGARWAGHWLATRADRDMNRISRNAPLPKPDVATQALHERILLADLHADSLMWPRDLTRRHDYGHADLPRLAAGGVGLQVFSVFTQTPRNMNFQANTADSDRITLLAIASGWPVRTWGSLPERALFQAARLRQVIRSSGGAMSLIRTRGDLANLIAAREGGSRRIGALLALEGAHALESDPHHLERLFEAGYRMLGLAHFFDNAVSGSAHGVEKHGLTELGRQLVTRAQAMGMVIDASHASRAAVRELLEMSVAPVVFSHSGVSATCPQHDRNLSDDVLQALARNRGVVGIALFAGATCGDDLDAFFRSLDHAVRVAGIEHVGFGSDFDGAVTTPIDATQWVAVTDGLLRRGYDPAEVAALAGGNVVRVLMNSLPE